MAGLANMALFALAAVLSALITPLVSGLCRRYRALDMPDSRKVHTRGIPRLGGVALFVALSLAMVIVVYGALGDVVDILPRQARLVPVIYLGLVGFFLVGFLDDLRSIAALPRLVAQFAIALLVVLLSGEGGIRISSVFGQYVFPEWLSVILTVLWIVAVVNTFNWIDGLDGLAGGLAGISAVAFLLLAALKPGLPNAGLTVALCAMLVGAVIGFMPHNFHPARIFLGDGGAFGLGYLLAVISVIGLFKQAAVISFFVPVAILALPLTDTAFAILRRLLKGKPVTEPDDRHIHHRMLALLSRRYRQRLPEATLTYVEERLVAHRAHRNTVLALYAFASVFAAIAVVVGLRT